MKNKTPSVVELPTKTRCQLGEKPLMLITEVGAVVCERTGDAPVVEKDCSHQRRRGSIIGARHVGPIQDTAADYETGRLP